MEPIFTSIVLFCTVGRAVQGTGCWQDCLRVGGCACEVGGCGLRVVSHLQRLCRKPQAGRLGGSSRLRCVCGPQRLRTAAACACLCAAPCLKPLCKREACGIQRVGQHLDLSCHDLHCVVAALLLELGSRPVCCAWLLCRLTRLQNGRLLRLQSCREKGRVRCSVFVVE